MKRLGQKICVAAVLSLAFVAIWHDSAMAAMPAISSIGQIKDSSVVNPTRIDVDAAGTIYLSDANVNGVTRYNKYGQVLPTLNGAYTVKSAGIAVTPDGSRVFVSVAAPGNAISTAVAVLDGSTGTLLGYLGNGFGEFQQVAEIDLDNSGNIYVGDYLAKTINCYNGSSYAHIDPVIGAGKFTDIAGLTVDGVNKEILVAEGWNINGVARVQVFGLDGTFKRILPEATIAGTQINCKPIALSIDPSGRIYMLSILTGTVHVFTTHPADTYLGKFTSATPDPAYNATTGAVIPWSVGMIPSPAFDTIYDPLTNRLFVVTDGNGIQIFSVDGSTNPIPANRAPSTPVMLSPVQGSEVATLTPTLQWAASLDADGDILTYNVRTIDANGVTVVTNNNVAAKTLSVAAGTLIENHKYGWQVQAADAVLTSPYSAVENFWVNAVEEAPSVALLVAPSIAATADKNTVFSWQAATDADPFDVLTYRLEIAKSTTLAPLVIAVEQSKLSSAPLSTLPGYSNLQSGETYQWRVVAMDGTGLTTVSETRSFVYTSTLLTVNATFPGAKVYIGGNSAYSGRFVGEVPVELRDINPGTIEVVVERPGFEPWVRNVKINAGQSLSVEAALTVAILPNDFISSPLLASGVKIQGGAESSPVVVDFDSDGIADLLVADGSGKLFLYKGVVNGKWALTSGVQLAGVVLPVGASPFVADWNNDDRKDLLVGAADGTVSLYLNIGTQAVPLFAAAVQLQADNAPLNVVSNASPVLFDLNNDGVKDLLVGSGNGSIYKFLNTGTDAAPVFAGREVLVAAEVGAVNASPVVTDWNADGSKEILLATNQGIALYGRQLDGTYTKEVNLVVQQSLYNSKTHKYEVSPANLGENVRLVVVNTDGIRGKDLLIGNAAGEILLAASSMNMASAISPLFDAALLETVVEVEALIQAHGRSTSAISSMLDQLKKNIQSQAVNKMNYYTKAKKNLVYLQNALKSDVEISVLLSKLQSQLNSEIPLN